MKLTNNLVRDIQNNILRSNLDERIRDLNKVFSQSLRDWLDNLYTHEEREIMSQAPIGAFYQIDQVTLNYDSKTECCKALLELSKDVQSYSLCELKNVIDLPTIRDLLYVHAFKTSNLDVIESNLYIYVDADVGLGLQGYLKKMFTMAEDAICFRDELINTLQAIFESCETLDSLITQYPKLIKYIPEDLQHDSQTANLDLKVKLDKFI